jgi:hypothetical protein
MGVINVPSIPQSDRPYVNTKMKWLHSWNGGRILRVQGIFGDRIKSSAGEVKINDLQYGMFLLKLLLSQLGLQKFDVATVTRSLNILHQTEEELRL